MNVNFNSDYPFRGKRKDNGEWVMGQLVIQQNEPIAIGDSDYYIEFDDYYIETDDTHFHYLIACETIEQYTGFMTYSNYDDELHKIFSGDLCYVSEFNREGKDIQHLCSVEFGCNFDCNNGVYFVDVNSDWYIAFNDVDDIESDVELVGNIYDNPELLEDNADNKHQKQFDKIYDVCIYKEENKTNND